VSILLPNGLSAQLCGTGRRRPRGHPRLMPECQIWTELWPVRLIALLDGMPTNAG
jgi:hypothetical protein